MRHGACARLGVGLLGTRAGGEPECHEQDPGGGDSGSDEAGAMLTDKPHDRPWGIYSGYFRDLDGHLREIMWNPPLDTETI